MKTLLIFLLLLIVCAGAMAQQPTRANPNTTPMYYRHTVLNDSNYSASTIDTTGVIKIGAALLASIQITTADTAAFDLYVDWRNRGRTTWTNAITDSLIYANTATGYKSLVIRDTDSDALDEIDAEVRVRVSARATGQGTTSPTYDLEVVWR